MSAPASQCELAAERLEDGRIELRSPDVGMFAGARGKDTVLTPGSTCGVLRTLGRDVQLLVPAGVGGTVVGSPPRELSSPVAFGEVLYVLDPEGTPQRAAHTGLESDALEGDELAVTASQAGRVWHSPSPDARPFCGPGDVLEDGVPICLIEVMKTFATLPYRATGGLPGRARVVRWLVEDGADVAPGATLMAIERA